MQRQALQHLDRRALHGDLVNRQAMQGPTRALATKEDVLDDVEVLAERKVLMHGHDAKGRRIACATKRDAPTADVQLALVWRADARNDLDQRGLAGTVVTHEPNDFAGPDVDPHAV